MLYKFCFYGVSERVEWVIASQCFHHVRLPKGEWATFTEIRLRINILIQNNILIFTQMNEGTISFVVFVSTAYPLLRAIDNNILAVFN